MIAWLEDPADFPDTRQALQEPNGLLAASAELSARWLLNAYPKGIFPWFNPGEPVLWWSPNPRMVLHVAEFKCSHSLEKTLRKWARTGSHTVTLNHAFDQVIHACAQPRPYARGTWITQDIEQAYKDLHRLGYAHSVETWLGTPSEGRLVGGLYCVAIGKMVYGESMFSTETDASKAALACLIRAVEPMGIDVIDCQQNTGHLTSLGGREISRDAFENLVQTRIAGSPVNWQPSVLLGHDKTD